MWPHFSKIISHPILLIAGSVCCCTILPAPHSFSVVALPATDRPKVPVECTFVICADKSEVRS
jgi:hypothetical protein